MRADKKTPLKADKKVTPRGHKRGVIGYSKKSALLEDAITQMNAGKYGRSSAALKELLALDPLNMEARRLFATLHLRLGSLLPARQAFESLANEALDRQDYWLAESLLREYLAAGPRCVPFIEKLGAVYQEKGDALAAAEEFAKAIDILIEDPDTDRPTRPAELYAKIRELAPASPPAFRLASLFDAQSGDLIARAPASEPAAPQVSSAVVDSIESTEPPVSNLLTVMADPVSGVMPWDDVPVGASVLPAHGAQPESPDQVELSKAASLELRDELPAELKISPLGDESLAPQGVLIDRAPGESAHSLSFPNSNSDGSVPVAPQNVEPACPPLAYPEMSSAAGASLGEEKGLASLSTSQDSWNPVSNEASEAVEAGYPAHSDVSTMLSVPASDVLPAPLPWEQVQETTIAIPQPDSEYLAVSLTDVSAAPVASPVASSLEPVHSQESDGQAQPSVTLRAGGETTLSSGTTQEFSPDVAWSVPDIPVMEPEKSLSVTPEASLTGSVVQAQPPDTPVEAVPPFMPEEQVAEASVGIDGSDRESISVQAEITGSFPTQSGTVFPSRIASHMTPETDAITSDLEGDRETREATSAPTADVLTQTVPPSGSGPSPTVGEFSWTSIFNTAWKFGSSSPAPHDSLQHAMPVEPSRPAEPVVHQEQAVAPVVSEEFSGHGDLAGTAESTPVFVGSAADASAPLPWEQIQDAPVTIPPVEFALSSDVEPAIGSFAMPGGSLQGSDQTAIQSEAVLPPVFQEETKSAANSPQGPESTFADVGQVETLVPPMPWEQIADAAITIPPAEIVPNSEVEPTGDLSVSPVEISGKADTQEAAAITHDLHEKIAAVIPSSEEMPESRPESISQARPAESPACSDQIHPPVVTPPTAEIVLGSTVESPMASTDSCSQAVDQNVTQVTMSVKSSAESTNDPIQDSRPIEAIQVESTESSFRFLDSKNIGTESIASTEKTPQPQHSAVPDNVLALQSAVSSSRDDVHTPVHSEEFRIASYPEPTPVTAELIKPDVPVSPAEPASQVSASAESAPPVLPQELIPVLQTLVDQLSVVTKTIPAMSSETKSTESSSRDQEVAPEAASLRTPSKAPSSEELASNPSSAQMPPTEEGPPSQWKTGEVAVQTHRPSTKKRKHFSDQSAEPSPAPFAEQAGPPVEPATEHVSTVAESIAPASVKEKEEWIRTGEAIRFVDPKAAEPAHLSPPPPAGQEEWRAVSPAASTAASAVDVLFQSSGQQTRTQTIERPAVPKPRPRISAKLARARIGLSVFIGSCFSTTRALVTSIIGLGVLCVAMLAVAIGAVGLTWLVMEEKPSPAFQSLTTTPQRAMLDSSKNGYLLLLGFEADAAADPVQAGYERKPDRQDGEMASVCQGGDEGMTGQKNASASVAQGWYRSADPTGQFKIQADSLRGWMSQANTSIGRYRQWLKMPFEDWGHGQAVTPPCAAILFAHRLHVAEGFNQGASTEGGVERLESDMEVWRTTLGQAKTLPVKMMALQAINDDIAVASGLLVKPDFDGKALPRITKMLRPLDPVESSMRWPMQSQLVLATKSYEAQLDADRGEDVPLHVSVASMLPLPKQRRFNDYAEYYEASYKTAGEGRYGAMPKRSTYIKHPATGLMDYLTNPIENIIGINPLPAWDHYNGLVIDTDAHLRLASLQAWLRRGPQDADLLARIAKAGQRLYDPYTGLPMLVNLKRGVMYSVGHDGKDQDADPQQDVVVSIPLNQPATITAKPVPKSK